MAEDRAAVVAGYVGGIRHQIEDGVNGFLVDDVDACAERIVQLLKSESLRPQLGERAQQTVREKFLMTRLMKEWLDLLASFEPNFRLIGGAA